MNLIKSFWIPLFIFGQLIIPLSVQAQDTVDHSLFDQLLKQHVHEGLINYDAINSDKQRLQNYLESLALVKPGQLNSDEQRLAFWINAYNASVIYRVLEHHPVDSVKTISGFFHRLKSNIAGEMLTLDSIEARAREFGDWRIHFALVCASSSCPLLRPEVYLPVELDEQLTEQTISFLKDKEKGVRLEENVLWVSKIFEWYSGDFMPDESGFFRRLNAEKLLNTLQPYLSEALIFKKGMKMKYMSYDWTLNRAI